MNSAVLRRNFRLETPLYRSSVSGNISPILPRPHAPSNASVIAWLKTSPSEWPIKPFSWGIGTPPRIKDEEGPNRWRSYPIPIRNFKLSPFRPLFLHQGRPEPVYDHWAA